MCKISAKVLDTRFKLGGVKVGLKELVIILPKERALEVITRRPDLIKWETFPYNIPKLPEESIDKYADRVDWTHISARQPLSEEFIAKHADRVNWKFISRYQKLSEPLSISLGTGSTGIIYLTIKMYLMSL